MTYVKSTFAPESLPQQPLPTIYDLPSEHPEDSGLPDEFHRVQADLLIRTFQPATYPLERVFAASDLNLYYDVENRNYYKCPDWFGVVDVPLRTYRCHSLTTNIRLNRFSFGPGLEQKARKMAQSWPGKSN